jgi:protein O-GlcNAc transferase
MPKEYFNHLEMASNYLKNSDFEAAIDECGKANAAGATGNERPEVLCLLGLIAFQMDDAGRGISLLGRAHELDPNCRDYADALAVMNAKVGKLSDGLFFGKLAVALEPNSELTPLIPAGFRNFQHALTGASLSSHHISARTSFERREYEKAVEFCEKELRIDRDNLPCVILMGKALLAAGRFDEAEDVFREAMQMAPRDVVPVADRAECLFHLGRFEEGLFWCRRALEMEPGNIDVVAKLEILAAFIPENADEFVKECRQRNFENISEFQKLEPMEVPIEQNKIRVGYLSNKFFDCHIGEFLSEVISCHDKGNFDIYCYQQNSDTDAVTMRQKAGSAEWRNIMEVDDDTAALIMAGDGLDIVVDLCDYKHDQRLALIAQKPATAVAGWLFWPSGAELGIYDFVMSDAACGDADQREAKSEVVLVNETCLAAIGAETAISGYSDVEDSPASKNGFVTFGGLCDAAMVTPEVAAAWARVLHAVPDSRLLLGNVVTIAPAVDTRIRALFSDLGLAERVVTQPVTPDAFVSGSFYAQVDVILDTFPVNAGMQACEALLIGIPVVSLAGNRRSALMGASILDAAGRPEWAAASEDAFVDAAVSLASDLTRLSDLRKTLGTEVAKSALCDRAGFTRALEGLYKRMYEETGPKNTD